MSKHFKPPQGMLLLQHRRGGGDTRPPGSQSCSHINYIPLSMKETGDVSRKRSVFQNRGRRGDRRVVEPPPTRTRTRFVAPVCQTMVTAKGSRRACFLLAVLALSALVVQARDKTTASGTTTRTSSQVMRLRRNTEAARPVIKEREQRELDIRQKAAEMRANSEQWLKAVLSDPTKSSGLYPQEMSMPTNMPTDPPVLTLEPTHSPTTATPTFVPTSLPTTNVPSESPATDNPTLSPGTNAPSDAPTVSTEEPTSSPSLPPVADTSEPSASPSSVPVTPSPTILPSSSPSLIGSESPSSPPTAMFSASPSSTPTVMFSASPSQEPSQVPIEPTSVPSSAPVTPTAEPSSAPSVDATECAADLAQSDTNDDGFISQEEYLILINILGVDMCYSQDPPLTAAQVNAYFTLVCELNPVCQITSELPITDLTSEETNRICERTSDVIPFSTCAPTTQPTRSVSPSSSMAPSSLPSESPSLSTAPSSMPSTIPTSLPSVSPSQSSVPSAAPTFLATSMQPSVPPSTAPSLAPSQEPTPEPTLTPTTAAPTRTCNLSPEQRRDFIGLVIEGISGSIVYTPDTPQNNAFNWLVDDDPETLCPDDETLRNRYILVVFYYSTDGDRWTRCRAPLDYDPETEEEANEACPNGNAWLTSGTACDWSGVTCDIFGEVTAIDQDSNNLTGELNSELGELGLLESLRLQKGGIQGSIPDIFDSLPFLQVLDFDFNFIGGELPPTLFGLSNLLELDLNHNRLVGEISTEFGRLSNLEFLSLHSNRLTGTIPRELGNLALLESATFHINFLEGSMPETICALPVLQNLTSDCFETEGRESPPFVECSCCTQCF